MDVLVFHLKGKMAHFRRYYSNSSALSYTIPPRTTIVGIIAGLLGYERDSYYDLFSLQQCHIAVTPCCPLKKVMQKLNLLMVKSPNDLNGSQENHSQTATELVIPQDLRGEHLDFKVWFYHHDNQIMQRVAELLTGSSEGYLSKGIALALGTAQHLGWIECEGVVAGRKVKEESTVMVSSVVPINKIKDFSLDNTTQLSLLREEVPLEFDSDRKLTVQGKGHMLINLLAAPVQVTINSHVSLENGENIVWME